VVKRFVAIGIGLVVAILVADVALRFVPPLGANPLPTLVPDMLRHSADARLGWELQPGALDHNRDGFRGRTYTTVPAPGTIRIAAVGDSVTYGLGLAAAEAFPTALEHELNAPQARPYEVLNFGVPGYSTFQVRRQLDQVWSWNPTVVMYTFSTDDSETSPVMINVGGTHSLFRNQFEQHWWLDSDAHWALVRWSPVYRLSSQTLMALASGTRSPDEVVLSAATAHANVRAIADACRARGIPFVLVLSPLIPPYPSTADNTAALAALRSLETEAAAWASLVVNLAPVYEHGRAAYQWADTDVEHHSRAGAAAVGAFLGTRLRETLFR
jgi:lysophospholipase L1-like esterase